MFQPQWNVPRKRNVLRNTVTAVTHRARRRLRDSARNPAKLLGRPPDRGFGPAVAVTPPERRKAETGPDPAQPQHKAGLARQREGPPETGSEPAD